MDATVPLTWRKSSHSRTYQCVEVGRTREGWPAVRDTKQRATGYIVASRQQWASFIDGIKTGRFDS